MTISVSKIVLSISMLLTICVALQFQNGESNVFLNDSTKILVYITNNITDLQLGVRCRSRNRDLGFQTLNFGETYSFSIYTAFEEMQYFCKFSWTNEFHYFDIYDQARDYPSCKTECRWKINKVGPCKINATSNECYHWDGEENNTLNV
jgi:hypothetical protein